MDTKTIQISETERVLVEGHSSGKTFKVSKIIFIRKSMGTDITNLLKFFNNKGYGFDVQQFVKTLVLNTL